MRRSSLHPSLEGRRSRQRRRRSDEFRSPLAVCLRVLVQYSSVHMQSSCPYADSKAGSREGAASRSQAWRYPTPNTMIALAVEWHLMLSTVPGIQPFSSYHNPRPPPAPLPFPGAHPQHYNSLKMSSSPTVRTSSTPSLTKESRESKQKVEDVEAVHVEGDNDSEWEGTVQIEEKRLTW
jgi:hypothetical protein